MSKDNEKSYDSISEQFINVKKQIQVPESVIEFGNILTPGITVLDVGCGSGVPNAKYLNRRGFQIFGIDISSSLLKEAGKNIPNGKFIRSDFVEFNTKRKFKGIIAYDSLFHLRYNEHEKAFKKLYSLLEKGGYLLFTHGGSDGEITGNMFGRSFSYSSLGPEKTKILLNDIGFGLVSWKIRQSKDPDDHGHLTSVVQKIS